MNKIICKNCSAENPFFELICRNCKAYIRERIYNIDLWQTIANLIEKPVKGFAGIIQSEHKNFIILVIILASVKFLLNIMLLSLVTLPGGSPFDHFIRNYFIAGAAVVLLLLFFSSVQKGLLKKQTIETRMKDNFAALSYSLLPHVFGVLILFPIEIVVFGGFLFSNNPSPFMLKETVAYMLLGFEVLIVLWQIFLTTISFFVQSGNIAFSLFLSLTFNLLLYYILYLFSYLII